MMYTIAAINAGQFTIAIDYFSIFTKFRTSDNIIQSEGCLNSAICRPSLAKEELVT